MKVYVVVTLYRGVEEDTRVFRSSKDADHEYRKFARACRVPYDHKLEDYDWSGSDYSAWWTECDVEE